MKRMSYLFGILAASGVLSGCQQQREPEPVAPAEASAAPDPPAIQLPLVALNREQLIIGALHAASATALGMDDEARQRSLDGRQFELRLRFGCTADTGDQVGSWKFDERRRVLSLRVEAGITDAAALPKVADKQALEAVEGFWIERPWMLQAGCPAVGEAEKSSATEAVQADAAKPGQQSSLYVSRIGIVQFFSDTDARTHRRGEQAYTTTKTLAEGVLPSAIGYDLVITGRLKRPANGNVILCAGRGPAAPPDCVVSAQFDSVTIQEPTSGEVIATWSNA